VTKNSESTNLKVVTFGLVPALFLLIATQGRAQTLPQLDVHNDPAGQFATYQPRGDTPETGAFFQSLGTNGRTCQTCHQPADAFSLSVSDINNTFIQTNGTDPLFAAIDGADCLDSTSHNLLLSHGLIRILLPISPRTFSGMTPQFTITVTSDPTNCQLANPNVQAQCATQFGAGFQCISVYRRPLPSTNLTFQDTLMWDGREPSPITVGLTAGLEQLGSDATVTHAQATSPPTSSQLSDMTSFQTGLFTAQMTDNNAGALTDDGATETPENMPSYPYFFGINSSGVNHTSTFNPDVFTFFEPWASLTGTDSVSLARESIARGETIFNTRAVKIEGFTTCSGCHNDPLIGNNSTLPGSNLNTNPSFLAHTGTDNPKNKTLQVGTFLPTFTFTCTTTGKVTTTTDPGRALITGACNDVTSIKIPTLHGLSGRAPYFHNGGAPDLAHVVTFYNSQFRIGLSTQDRTDLVNFLNTL
jgi:cytochrome c peroxidase